MKLREIMTPEPVTVQPSTSLREAARLMRDADIGDVLISDGNRLLGILTDRDITVRAVAEGMDMNRSQVGQFMSRDPFSAAPDWDVEQAADLMAKEQIRRLPVMEEGVLVGIVSLGDIAVDLEAAGVECPSPAGEALEDISKPAEPRLERIKMM